MIDPAQFGEGETRTENAMQKQTNATLYESCNVRKKRGLGQEK